MTARRDLDRVFDFSLLVVVVFAAFISFRVAPILIPADNGFGPSYAKLAFFVPVAMLPVLPLALIARNQGWYTPSLSGAPDRSQSDARYLITGPLVILQVWIAIWVLGPHFLDLQQIVAIAVAIALLNGLIFLVAGAVVVAFAMSSSAENSKCT